MMLRTGKSSRYRSYACSTKARQGMETLDTLVAEKPRSIPYREAIAGRIDV